MRYEYLRIQFNFNKISKINNYIIRKANNLLNQTYNVLFLIKFYFKSQMLYKIN